MKLTIDHLKLIMTPYLQLIKHDPRNGVYGDCFRTAIACLIDIHPKEVPHVFEILNGEGEAGEAITIMNDWLKKEHGVVLVSMAFAGDLGINKLTKHFSEINPNIYYLVCGTSIANCNHNVIFFNDEFVHDPSTGKRNTLTDSCDDGYWWISVLAKSL